MSHADAPQDGVYAWMASVRASMDNDPSRQIFESQVQSHALVFLDDYLEQILAGPKQGPIIELVKTPGRRKNIPRRTRAAATVKGATPFSLDDVNSTQNLVPVNSFHKALLLAQHVSVQDALDPQESPAANGSAGDSLGQFTQVADTPEIPVPVAPKREADAMLPQHHPTYTPKESSMPFPTSDHITELSIIAEGDESPERSFPLLTDSSNQDGCSQSVPLFRHGLQDHSVTDENPELTQASHCHKSHGDLAPDTQYFVPSPVGTHHGNPLDIPREVQSSGARENDHTEPLPSGTAISSPSNRERNAFTAPLPVVPVPTSIPITQAISVPLNDSSPRMQVRKSGAVGFRMLPAPSPLRKSVRATQDVSTSSVLPVFAPAPVPLGKRTSWLMKAREAKAMEGTSSLPGSGAADAKNFPGVSTAVKRKSEEMLCPFPPEPGSDEGWRKLKVAKSTEDGVASTTSQEMKPTQCDFPSLQGEPFTFVATMSEDHLECHPMDIDKHPTHLYSPEEGFIDLFKRTVEGLGARAGKSTDKSFGGAAVAALAEARAAAEARVAERNKTDNEFGDPRVPRDGAVPDQEPLEGQARPDNLISFALVEETTPQLGLSYLVPDTLQPNQSELSTKMTQAIGGIKRSNSGDDSTTTTPLDSPPPKKGGSGLVKPGGPVFNKPPVFMPPVAKRSAMASEHPREFTLPAAVTLGIPARLTTPSDGLLPVVQGTSTFMQSSQTGKFSDPDLDKPDGVLPWVSSARDSLHTMDLQPRDPPIGAGVVDDDDDDDSWPLEEKLAAAEPGWRPFDFSNVDKEDTWSSLPTESQGPTRNLTMEIHGDSMPSPSDTNVEVDSKSERAEQEQEIIEISDAEHSVDAPELGGIAREIDAFGGANSKSIARATSQSSIGSTASSSQSQTGFFSQATKLVHHMLGGAKKAKPELKSLQLAAAAAKKQQEEADKKTQRLKDMEVRRQVALAKRAGEERSRLLEEKKGREEAEKRKREREENTDRRLLKPSVSIKKAEEDLSRKRKLAPEAEKKLDSKKPPSKDKKDLASLPFPKQAVTPATKLAATKGTKITATALVSSAAYNATQNPPSAKSTVPESRSFKIVPSLKGTAKAKPQQNDMGDKLPSTVVQSQMAARVKAQMQAAKVPAPEVPSESIELPDINSEYSDSEDGDRVRTFDPPEWAQSPELRQALQMQSTVNPDDIFGEIRPLKMEEMFRTRQSRFRARTSSANWSGSDRLTAEEIREYERRMGFQ